MVDNETANETQQDEQPLTGVTLKELQTLIGNMVNSSVTAKNKSFKQEMATQLAEFRAGIESLSSQLKTPTEKAESDKDRELKTLRADMQRLTEQIRAADEANAAMERERRTLTARSELRTALTGKVRPELLDDVAFILENRNVNFEDGAALMRIKKTTRIGTEEVNLPIADAVREWLSQPEARPYVPAPVKSETPTKNNAQLPARQQITPVKQASGDQTVREFLAELDL